MKLIEKIDGKDIKAGIVVFLVALPLCLGIALASGVPLFSGIIAGIVGGIVVSLLSGSSLAVSGPAAGLTVIVLASVDKLGSLEAFFLAVVLAGFLQFLFGVLKTGFIASYFPSSVIKGMLAAIGLILILKQIPHLVGFDKDYLGDLAFWQQDNHNTFSEIIYSLGNFEFSAIIISAISIFILILWDKDRIKKLKFFQFIPGPLAVVILGIIVNEIIGILDTSIALRGEHLVLVPVSEGLVNNLFEHITFPSFSSISYDVITVAITLALVASIETLLCVEATDKMDPEKRVTPSNRELKAQGIGNMISGFLGGLPMTAVIVRSTANINAGGRTKFSSFFHGVLLLASVILIPGLLNKIPLASLAVILLFTGYKLTRIPLLKEMYRLGWTQAIPFFVTIIAILLTDLLIGVGIGMLVAMLLILIRQYQNSMVLKQDFKRDGNYYQLTLNDTISFLNKPRISAFLEAIPANSRVTIQVEANSLDPDIKDILKNFMERASLRNIKYQILQNKSVQL